ncbi:MAG: hypothetical protein K9K67_01620 [Bacteriovoracaceae bacterium]|nr:hypothetical protein [Bacteriovoracaceae bacterium]
MYLFLDSSLYIQIGLLDADLNWKHYEMVPNKKGSQVLHSIIYSSLNDHNIKVQDLKGIFLANGPGSYTGIRVAEGVCQILEMEGLPIYSFYHFEVPSFAEVKEYKFFAEAFKGEVFQYSLKLTGEDFELISEKSFNLLDLSEDHLYHLEGLLMDRELDNLYDLYKKEPTKIFSQVLKRAKHLPPYYYRPEEKEFNLPRNR